MTMVDDRKDDEAFEALFRAGRRSPPEMSETFLNRLNSDADASVPAQAKARARATKGPLFGPLRGWFAASGLSGAAVIGMWIGFVMPEVVGDFNLASEDTVELYTFFPGADLTATVLDE